MIKNRFLYLSSNVRRRFHTEGDPINMSICATLRGATVLAEGGFVTSSILRRRITFKENYVIKIDGICIDAVDLQSPNAYRIYKILNMVYVSLLSNSSLDYPMIAENRMSDILYDVYGIGKTTSLTETPPNFKIYMELRRIDDRAD